MAAYLIADLEIIDPAGYDEYREQAPGTLAKYGGRYLVRGGAHETLEGEWRPGKAKGLIVEGAASARGQTVSSRIFVIGPGAVTIASWPVFTSWKLQPRSSRRCRNWSKVPRAGGEQ